MNTEITKRQQEIINVSLELIAESGIQSLTIKNLANENTNGLIRQYIPKGTDFSEVTNKRIKWIENNLNNRPRKRLGYLTPNEKFKQIINMNSVAFRT